MKEKAPILTDEEVRQEQIQDTLENLISSLGTDLDKREATAFKNKVELSRRGAYEILTTMYKTDGFSGKIVDIIPEDMTRNWRQFTGELDDEIVQELEKEERRLDIKSAFLKAYKWARLYGTAYIIMSIDDGQTSDKELKLKNVKPGGLRYMHVVERRQMVADINSIENNPLEKNFRMPRLYQFTGIGAQLKIHASRIIRFEGRELPPEEFRKNNYESGSILEPLYDSILNFNIIANSSASMVFETNVDVIKIPDLMHKLSSQESTAAVSARLRFAKLNKSNNNMLVLSGNEDFETKTNTFAGLRDLQVEAKQSISSFADIPGTRLLGDAASGLNATGEGDQKNYIDKIEALQDSIFRPRLDYVDPILAKSLGLSDEADLQYSFKSVFVTTPSDQAELDLKRAERDIKYLENNVITPSIVVKNLQRAETYPDITDEYVKLMEDEDEEYFNNETTDPNTEKEIEIARQAQEKAEEENAQDS